MTENKKVALIFVSVIAFTLGATYFVQRAHAQTSLPTVYKATKQAVEHIGEQADAHVKAYYEHMKKAVKDARVPTYQLREATAEEAETGLIELINGKTDDRLFKYLHNGFNDGTVAHGAVDVIVDKDGDYEFDFQNWRLKKHMKAGYKNTLVFPLSARPGQLHVNAGEQGTLYFSNKRLDFKKGDSFALSNSLKQ